MYPRLAFDFIFTPFLAANGSLQGQVGGLRLAVGTEKAQSQKDAQ
jgi:hypothetical protein